VPENVTEDERGGLEPGNPPEGAQVGREREIPIALLPARDAVARHRIHLHVECEQVVAPFDAVLGHLSLDEELPVQALSHQPALHVGERHDDRVDRAVFDGRGEVFEHEHRMEPNAGNRRA
jgi:hypothetical protein